MPHAWSEHVYGDPITSGGPLEPWDEPVDSHGYRWQINVADTWHQVNRAVALENGIAPMDVWVTEYNTSARGVEGSNAPEASYTSGWMFNALARMAVSLPTLRGAWRQTVGLAQGGAASGLLCALAGVETGASSVR